MCGPAAEWSRDLHVGCAVSRFTAAAHAGDRLCRTSHCLDSRPECGMRGYVGESSVIDGSERHRLHAPAEQPYRYRQSEWKRAREERPDQGRHQPIDVEARPTGDDSDYQSDEIGGHQGQEDLGESAIPSTGTSAFLTDRPLTDEDRRNRRQLLGHYIRYGHAVRSGVLLRFVEGDPDRLPSHRRAPMPAARVWKLLRDLQLEWWHASQLGAPVEHLRVRQRFPASAQPDRHILVTHRWCQFFHRTRPFLLQPSLLAIRLNEFRGRGAHQSPDTTMALHPSPNGHNRDAGLLGPGGFPARYR